MYLLFMLEHIYAKEVLDKRKTVYRDLLVWLA